MRKNYLFKVFMKNKRTMLIFARDLTSSRKDYKIQINLSKLPILDFSTEKSLGDSFSAKRTALSFVYLERLYKLGFLN
jgi:hypothetical protein